MLAVVIVLSVVKSRCHNMLVDTHWHASSERSGSSAAVMDDAAELWMRRCTDSSRLAPRAVCVTVVMRSARAKTSNTSHSGHLMNIGNILIAFSLSFS